MADRPDQPRPDHQTFDMSDTTARARALAGVLAWFQAMGVDQAVENEPTNWLARGSEPPQRYVAPRITPAPRTNETVAARRAPTMPGPPSTSTAGTFQPSTSSPPSVTMSDEAAETHARDTARHARSLQELHELLKSFDGCGLKKTAKNLCFYRGASQARVMIIGEAPGRDEDLAGVPFVGSAGQLLDKMLASIGLSEADTHITNVVYWRPPGNRVPTPQETLTCRPFLERQIRLVQPELIVTVGGAAAKLILDTSQGIMKVRGKWGVLDVSADAGEQEMKITVMPTLHPAYLLRSPAHKRHAWRDLLAVKARLDASQETADAGPHN